MHELTVAVEPEPHFWSKEWIDQFFRYDSHVGDYVRLPDGRLGTVQSIDIVCGGNHNIVSVLLENGPKGFFAWLWGGRIVRFTDDEILTLEKLAARSELKTL